MAKLNLVRALALFTVAACAPTSASAHGGSHTVNLRAEVQLHCQVGSDSVDTAIELVDGRADLGDVREICNSPSGYQLLVKLVNLDGGTLSADGEEVAVDATGEAIFTSREAQMRTRHWVLNGASTIDSAMPAYMRVSIVPFRQ